MSPCLEDIKISSSYGGYTVVEDHSDLFQIRAQSAYAGLGNRTLCFTSSGQEQYFSLLASED